MKQEYWLAVVIGFVILAYILDSLVNPLTIGLPTPYHYFIPESFMTFPFTSTSIVIKAVAIYIGVILFLSFIEFKKSVKGIILFIVGGLMQLYSIQDVVTGSRIVPLEWALAITLSGIALLLTSFFFIIAGAISGVAGKTVYDNNDEEFKL